jgi:hypothetical protein
MGQAPARWRGVLGAPEGGDPQTRERRGLIGGGVSDRLWESCGLQCCSWLECAASWAAVRASGASRACWASRER